MSEPKRKRAARRKARELALQEIDSWQMKGNTSASDEIQLTTTNGNTKNELAVVQELWRETANKAAKLE